jgi:hypothetical protein
MARRSFLLKDAFSSKSYLLRSVKKGMKAFLSSDVKLVAEAERSRIGDSLDLDTATRDEFPEENRWDYLTSLPDRSGIVGIEPHHARDSEISVVIAKKQQATACLQSHLRDGYRVRKWFWVSSSKVGFSRMDRTRRLLDQNGIKFVGKVIRTFD